MCLYDTGQLFLTMILEKDVPCFQVRLLTQFQITAHKYNQNKNTTSVADTYEKHLAQFLNIRRWILTDNCLKNKSRMYLNICRTINLPNFLAI